MVEFFPLIVFIGIIVLVITQPKIKRFQLDYGFAPLLGVLILLITFQISPSVLLVGIIGTPTIKPYMIILLFFSLAYLCISIDLTGFFAYLALVAAKKSGSSGRKLFFYFCLLSSILTTFTSNDIVILTLTPIIVYFCTYTKTNPVPYLIGQFFMANIWSVALYIGNPTNIIVAQAYNLTFIEYSTWMVLPTIVAGLSCYFLMLWIFKKDLPMNISPPNIDPKSAIKDKPGAIFGLVMLGLCLILLSLAPVLHFDMGLICLIFALLMVGKDIAFDLKNKTEKNIRFPSIREALNRMPWKIMPFVFGMFVMVEVLSLSGWITLFSNTLASLANRVGVIPSLFIMSFLSSLSCNIMNNQPMTILFTRMLQDSSFNLAVSSLTIKTNMYALIMGSNFGANFTLIGALAGIMWSNISADKGVHISYKRFAYYGFRIMPIVVILASIMLAIEFLL